MDQSNTVNSSMYHSEVYDQEPLYLKAIVGYYEYKIMIDTGSSISLISSNLLKNLENSGHTCQYINKTVKTTSATNNHMPSSGMVKLSFNLTQNNEFNHQFLICDDIIQNIVLGADFLTKNQFSLDFYNKTMNCHNFEVPLYYRY